MNKDSNETSSKWVVIVVGRVYRVYVFKMVKLVFPILHWKRRSTSVSIYTNPFFLAL